MLTNVQILLCACSALSPLPHFPSRTSLPFKFSCPKTASKCTRSRAKRPGCSKGNAAAGNAACHIRWQPGCSCRHLRQAYAAKFRASPVRYRSSCKPPLTKILLADTPLAVTNVFKTSGFGCLRRFNDLFKKQYRQPPTILRKQAMLACSTDLTAYNAAVGLPKQPYPWLQVIGSLSARSISVVDTASDDACISTIQHVDDAQVSASGQGSTSTCVR